MKEHGRAYAKINLDAISHNLDSIERKIARQSRILAVVKADGYGHGAKAIAKEIEGRQSVFGFGVATADEAFALREAGVEKPILTLGYTFAEDSEALLAAGIRPTVYSYEMAKAFSLAAGRIGKKAAIHIKIDTGMSRIGYQANDGAIEEIVSVAKLPGIVIEGIFTHFASADEAEKASAYGQLGQFQDVLESLRARGLAIPLRHCANSAAIAEMPEADLGLVRAGIILYGLWPSREVRRDSLSLMPAMELKSRIVQIKELEAGRRVSYGGTYQLKERRKVATVPVGYADGYPRSLSNRGHVLIHGKKAPILGRICMDQMMADVTDIPGVKLLDTVTLLGEDGGAFLGMEELGDVSGRFNYEFACLIGKRMPRVYYKDGVPYEP